jgi:hypothetical protein
MLPIQRETEKVEIELSLAFSTEEMRNVGTVASNRIVIGDSCVALAGGRPATCQFPCDTLPPGIRDRGFSLPQAPKAFRTSREITPV